MGKLSSGCVDRRTIGEVGSTNEFHGLSWAWTWRGRALSGAAVRCLIVRVTSSSVVAPSWGRFLDAAGVTEKSTVGGVDTSICGAERGFMGVGVTGIVGRGAFVLRRRRLIDGRGCRDPHCAGVGEVACCVGPRRWVSRAGRKESQ